MTKDLPLSACCSAPIKSVGMGDFHDKDEVCTMHMECEKCGKPCYIKTEEDPPIVDGFGSVWSQRCPACKKLSMSVVRPGKVQCDSEKCNTPESDEGNSRESCSPPSSAGLRDLLHDFAMTYRVESRKSRNECIDNVIMKIGNLMEENQSVRNKNRVLQDCVVAVMVEKKVLRKALEKMVKASDELNDDCDSGDRHDPECSMCKSTKEAKESLSQVSQYSASTQTLKQAFDDVEDSLSKSE